MTDALVTALLAAREDHRQLAPPSATKALSVADLIADGVYASAIVVGCAIVATNAGAEVMGDPLNSLAWIANHLGARGLGLRAGDVVMSGSVSTTRR